MKLKFYIHITIEAKYGRIRTHKNKQQSQHPKKDTDGRYGRRNKLRALGQTLGIYDVKLSFKGTPANTITRNNT